MEAKRRNETRDFVFGFNFVVFKGLRERGAYPKINFKTHFSSRKNSVACHKLGKNRSVRKKGKLEEPRNLKIQSLNHI